MNKLWKIVLPVFVVGILLGASIVAYAATPTATFYIGSGTYPNGYDRILWREGANYFVKNNFGEILTDGTNATTVLRSCTTEGNSVFLRSGVYEIPAIPFMDSNLTITGEDRDKTILRVTGSGSFTTGHGLRNNPNAAREQNILIESLTVDCSGYSDTQGIAFNGADYVTVRNVVVMSNNGTNRALVAFWDVTFGILENSILRDAGFDSTDCEAVYFEQTNNSIIRHNLIMNNSREGIYIDGGSNFNEIYENDIIENGNEGIDVKPYANWNHIHDNFLDGNVEAIMLTYTGTDGSDHNKVSGNVIANHTNGIVSYFQNHVQITDNKLFNISSVSINTWNNWDSLIEGNIIQDTYYGILARGFSNGTINGNTITEPSTSGAYGIKLGHGSEMANFTVLTGNYVNGYEYGIFEHGGLADYNAIVGCSVFDCDTVNIFLNSSNSECHASFNGTTWVT